MKDDGAIILVNRMAQCKGTYQRHWLSYFFPQKKFSRKLNLGESSVLLTFTATTYAITFILLVLRWCCASINDVTTVSVCIFYSKQYQLLPISLGCVYFCKYD